MGVEGQYNVANAIYLHIHTIQFLQMVGTSLQFLFSDTVPRQQKVVTSTFHIMSKPERQLILFFHHHTLGVCGRHLINLHVQPTKKTQKTCVTNVSKNNYYIPCATCGEGTAYPSAEYDFTPGVTVILYAISLAN
jgi:hypothetical protein